METTAPVTIPAIASAFAALPEPLDAVVGTASYSYCDAGAVFDNIIWRNPPVAVRGLIDLMGMWVVLAAGDDIDDHADLDDIYDAFDERQDGWKLAGGLTFLRTLHDAVVLHAEDILLAALPQALGQITPGDDLSRYGFGVRISRDGTVTVTDHWT